MKRALVFAVLALACDREERRFEGAGGRFVSQPLRGVVRAENHTDNAWSVSEGQRLYMWFNCSGCHGMAGGGGMGPALRDSTWIYGASFRNVYDSIAQGRPNGMPRYGDRVTDGQISQLATYVLALSGRLPADVLPSRNDHASTGAPPARTPVLPETRP